MKNKKGFTLIELLAVLVILAILALITIPIVISIIRNAKENSYRRSIEIYGRAVETAIMEYDMNNDSTLPTTISSYSVKTTGNKVVCNDNIQGINSEEGITLTNCKVVDDNNVQKSKDTYSYHNGKTIKEEQVTYEAYNVGDEITVANEQYYIISVPENEDYVVALKANPLTATEITNAGGAVAYTYSDANTTGGMVYGQTSDYGSSAVKSVVNNWAGSKFTNNELEIVDGYGARLATKVELQPIGWPSCTLDSVSCPKETDTPSWLYDSNYWYWTMSPPTNSSSDVWYVANGGYLYNIRVSNYYGAVRPVINVYKSAIQNNS